MAQGFVPTPEALQLYRDLTYYEQQQGRAAADTSAEPSASSPSSSESSAPAEDPAEGFVLEAVNPLFVREPGDTQGLMRLPPRQLSMENPLLSRNTSGDHEPLSPGGTWSLPEVLASMREERLFRETSQNGVSE